MTWGRGGAFWEGDLVQWEASAGLPGARGAVVHPTPQLPSRGPSLSWTRTHCPYGASLCIEENHE